MLILDRYPGQSIHIGKDIRITFVGNMNGRGRIGIDAPRSMSILRDEIKGSAKDTSIKCSVDEYGEPNGNVA